jgi:very-short-patch-repair endonuclease
MEEKRARPDEEIARLAGSQHGVVSADQLLRAGLGRNAISDRVRAGRLHGVHRNVYAVGHRFLSQQGIWMAAVLACSTPERKAVLSHRSAAELWGLLKVGQRLSDVTVGGDGGRRPRAGIRIHRSTSLDSSMTTRRLGIPVTTPARTIVDLRRTKPVRGGATAARLRRAIRQAGLAGLKLSPEIEDDHTRSDLERDFLKLCRRRGLPVPEVNVKIGGIEADFVWREQCVIAETDSYRYHQGPGAFRDDRRRALELRALGFEVIRLSEEQVNQEPERLASVLIYALEG